MTISASERAERAVGQAAVRELERVGLKIIYRDKELPRYARYYASEVKFIGHVYVEDEHMRMFVRDYDENGYEIAVASERGFVWTEWRAAQGCKNFEVIG